MLNPITIDRVGNYLIHEYLKTNLQILNCPQIHRQITVIEE